MPSGDEILGLRRRVRDASSGLRMQKCDALRVQRLSPDQRLRHAATSTGIDDIADDGMTESGEMDSQLMGPSGLRHQSHVRRLSALGNHFVLRHRRPSPTADRHAFAMHGISADRRIERSSFLAKSSPDQGDVALVNLAATKLSRQIGQCTGVLRNDDDTGSILVQAVDQPRSQRIEPGQRASPTVKQRADQRPSPVASSRMNDQPGGLVDHKQRLILMENFERDALGQDIAGRRNHRGFDANGLTDAQDEAGLRDSPVDLDVAAGNETLHLRPRAPPLGRGEVAVEPLVAANDVDDDDIRAGHDRNEPATMR